MSTTPRAAEPAGTRTIRRDLNDGAGYTLTAAAHGVTVVTVRGVEGKPSPAFDRDQVGQLIRDLELVAGLRGTAPALGRALALAGSIRIIFEHLRELDKTEPAEVAAILRSIVEHVRRWNPIILLGGGAV